MFKRQSPNHIGILRWESADTVGRKKGYMKDAQHQWRFSDELRSLDDQDRGAALLNVKTRSGISEEQAKRDVDAWMEGKQF